MKQFCNRLNYSFGNEDWNTERQALKIKPGDRVVCITASGDRTLHLLLDDCSDVVSIDLNPIQNHLLNLKIAAMQYLDYNDYLEFLGGTCSTDRIPLWNKIKDRLPQASNHFWQNHLSMIQKGVLYQGATEVIASRISRLICAFRQQKIKKLFEFDDLEEQIDFVNREWSTYFWKKAVQIALHPSLNRLWINDPGLYKNLGKSVNPARYLYNRMHDYLHRHLAKESILLSFVFQGRVNADAFPPYLTLEGSKKISQRLSSINVTTDDILKYLADTPDNSFDCFSLSDVASYISQKDFEVLLHSIYRTARPGARFCLRQFMSDYSIPLSMKNKFCQNHELEQRLEKEDRTFVYRFITGTIGLKHPFRG